MIKEYEVSGLIGALKASGYPLALDEPHVSFSRGRRLGRAKVGSGHDCYLKGITVLVTIEASLKWFDQLSRYSFQDTVSSTSQMHKLKDIDLNESFTSNTDPVIINRLNELRENYINNPNEENYRIFLDSVPQGILYTRTIVTNYLQLKTIYHQRKNHKLSEWRDFCKWIETLPNFKDLVLGE